jgi:hypothetical protein
MPMLFLFASAMRTSTTSKRPEPSPSNIEDDYSKPLNRAVEDVL